MATIEIDIVSAEGQIHHGEAAMVFAPATEGELGIAPRHAPLLTTLKPGEVRVRGTDGVSHSFFVGGGILEVQPHLVTIMADTAIRTKDADMATAEAAKARAKEKLANATSELDVKRANLELVQASALAELLNKIKHTAH
jgi:F-type H+-transporting ATPase subunit epsilon